MDAPRSRWQPSLFEVLSVIACPGRLWLRPVVEQTPPPVEVLSVDWQAPSGRTGR